MKAHVINLEHRIDRLEFVKAELEREGLELVRHNAVNGHKELVKTIKTSKMRGHGGCQISHMNVLKSVKGTAEYHLVFEDDVVLMEGFSKELEHVVSKLPDWWTFCYLGGNTKLYKNAVMRHDDTFNRALSVVCAHAYLIRDSAIDDILEILEKKLWKADVLLIEYQQNNMVFITKKCMTWQRKSYSDILMGQMKIETKYK